MPTIIPSADLPKNFVEKFPERGPWFSAATPPTPHAFSIEVVLADGTAVIGTWTGKVWWRHEELHPVAWRSFEPPKY